MGVPWGCVCLNTPDPEEHHCGIPLTGGPWSPEPRAGRGQAWLGEMLRGAEPHLGDEKVLEMMA